MWHGLLRRGAVRALDLDDYDPEEMTLEVRHRPETGTPIKNKHRGERYVALSAEVSGVIDAWIEDRRPEATDEHGRLPLLATIYGRPHLTTIQSYVYSITRPCEYTRECPHHRTISSCNAAEMRSAAHGCPSSISPHCIRRGAITHWLSSDVPEQAVSERANVSIRVIEEHYDRRTQRKKMEQRRKYLSRL
jgi:integrase